MNTPETYFHSSVELLQQLIATPSFSGEEDKTADLIFSFFESNKLKPNRHLNNVWLANEHFDSKKPTILLNSHHDTVRPNNRYTKDPFQPLTEDGKLYGLGSNDAGGCVVCLIAAFLHFYFKKELKYNLIVALTAEEEISGRNGIEALLPLLPPIDFGIVGEPTQMQLAVSEKGLLVIDAMAKGISGHAARNEGDNAITKAVSDINWIHSYRFPKVSDWLGEVKMSVTVIHTYNRAHNVVPAECRFVIDIRVPETYTHREIIDTLQKHLQSEITPRSVRLKSSHIDIHHPIVKAGIEMGKKCFGSPTGSDRALMNFPALKCGPGDSARSHTADEYICLHEIKEGIYDYIQMIQRVIL